MKLSTAKDRFLSSWEQFAINLGLSRAMAQIHGLLLTSPEALTTDEIMKQLKMSRGNASMNLRALIEWGLIARESRHGMRKELFSATKNAWDIVRAFVRKRFIQDFESLSTALIGLAEVSPDKKHDKQIKEFKKLHKELDKMLARLKTQSYLVLRGDERRVFPRNQQKGRKIKS